MLWLFYIGIVLAGCCLVAGLVGLFAYLVHWAERLHVEPPRPEPTYWDQHVFSKERARELANKRINTKVK